MISVITNEQRRLEPSKIDPSRMTTLRNRFVREFGKRFNQLSRDVFDLVYTQDVFGLKPKTRSRLIGNTRWQFRTTSEQVRLFEEYLKENIDLNILPVELRNVDDAYFHAYIEEGYRKGAGRAFTEVKKPAVDLAKGNVSDFYDRSKEEFLRSAFARPETVDKVKLLAGRVFTDLKNVTESMSAAMQRSLTTSLTRGDGARQAAKELTDSISGIGKRRAETIARTELMRAHNEGALDTYEAEGVTELNVLVEWSTAGDLRVCPQCVPLEGAVFKTAEIRGLLPRHPNCRCTPIPANVGEDKSGQIRDPKDINKAISKSISRERRKKGKPAGSRKTSKWKGADLKVTTERPPSIFDADYKQKTKPSTPSTPAAVKPKPKPKSAAPKKPSTQKRPKPVKPTSIVQWAKYAKDKGLAESVSFAGIEEVGVAETIVTRLEELASKYKDTKLKRISPKKMKGALAYVQESRRINTLTGEVLSKEVTYHVNKTSFASKKVYKETTDRFRKNFIASTEMEDVLTHEFGHALEAWYGDDAIKQILYREHLKDLSSVSTYAQYDPDEAIAELFSVWHKIGDEGLKNLNGKDFSKYAEYFKERFVK